MSSRLKHVDWLFGDYSNKSMSECLNQQLAAQFCKKASELASDVGGR